MAALCGAALVGCNRGAGPAADAAKPGAKAASAPMLLVAPEDLRTIGASALARGPVIAGSVQPERRADLRAEISAVVHQVLKDNGETVRRGDLLVRLDDTAIRDSLSSAEEAARAAGQSYEQAERQFTRLKTLQAQGMTSTQAMEDAEIRRNNAQSDLVAAKARAVSARQQLTRTEVRAPFEGVVSERKVSSGDTAQMGKELVKVIDPTSMRFEGLVSAEGLPEIKVGQPVGFHINGIAGTEFRGTVRRVDAAANATTRQIAVLVDFAKGSPPAPRVAGLFAEGRIETGTVSTLVVPESSVVRSGDSAYVWRLKDGKVARAAVKLGERDERNGGYPVRSGLAAGDRILRHPSTSLSDGQKVELAPANPVSPSASAASVTKG
ncbi:MAG: efflux RND transporter periplasmic adaptor subunit [Burkholderiales bacterium]|nr:efflux RND transporter periplasmic adaptor subunit [Burkholderiales bacterium]